MNERERELKATMLAAILAQGVPTAQAIADAELAVRYVMGGAEPVAPRPDPKMRRDQVLDMWAEGLSTRLIASRVGLTRAGVCTIIHKARREGEPRAVRRQQLSPGQIEKIRERGRKYGGDNRKDAAP